MSRASHSRQSLKLSFGAGERVPAVLQLPTTAAPAPAVLLLHGFSSRKERMADSIGRALLTHGVASLAIDLPMHGAREGSVEGLSLRNPLALVQRWKQAVGEAHAAIGYLAERSEIDAGRLAIGGYSLGAFLASVIAADNPLVRAVALAAGGDLPEQTPFASVVRSIADPLRGVRRLNGRPLLMVNGRNDRTVTPAQARALFEAAREPKELVWYDGGHWPPAPAIAAVADWLAATLSIDARTRAGRARSG